MDRHPDVELLATRTLVEGRIFDLLEESVRLPSGLRQDLLVVDHPGAVCVAAIGDDGRLLCVRQYRHAVGDWLVEIPAGRLEREDTDPLAAAKRELEEETGHRARRWRELCRFYPAPGFCSEQLVVFAAEGLEAVPGGGLDADPDEELELAWLAPQELLAQPRGDAKTWIAAARVLAERR